jgi:hypothetical protein
MEGPRTPLRPPFHRQERAPHRFPGRPNRHACHDSHRAKTNVADVALGVSQADACSLVGLSPTNTIASSTLPGPTRAASIRLWRTWKSTGMSHKRRRSA